MDKYTVTKRIKEICSSFGFFKVGISKVEPFKQESVNLKQWLSEGRQAEMEWMNFGTEKRIDPAVIMPEVKSIISLAYLYDTPFTHSESTEIPKISRYAWGETDYHKIIKRKLKEICYTIEKYFDGAKIIFYVDDGPVLEKNWAVKSGIGWQGKNTLVINPEYGSFFFLAEIFISVELAEDEPIEDLCSTCNLCTQACPTNALYDEYKLDANLCIAYHTIENRNVIPEYMDLNNWIFGCDICQDVCPHNKKKHFTIDKSFHPKPNIFNKTRQELLNINEEEFNNEFAGTPIKRSKYDRWKRNLEFKN